MIIITIITDKNNLAKIKRKRLTNIKRARNRFESLTINVNNVLIKNKYK